MDIVGTIKAVAVAVGEFFGFVKQREALKNTPEFQANATAAGDAKAVGRIAAEENAAAGGDLDPLRKEIGE